MNLSQKSCVPSSRDAAPFSPPQALIMKVHLHPAWDLIFDGTRLLRRFRFKNFKDALALAVIIGELAESENHHPDLHIGWGRLEVEITTHAVHGLVENDFIFAAKVDKAFDDFFATGGKNRSSV